MSRIRADRYTNRAGTGAPTFADGVNVVGITSVKAGAGVTTLEVTGDLSVISGTIKGASELSISGITSSISDTAVDVFVYDTSKDSDGGAWRKRTQNTSWYNETLNTSTRGSRKEFPAVAVIVAEAAKVTIYDGDDPDLPLWMMFETNSSDMLVGNGINAVTVLNGILSVVRNTPIIMIDFIKDNQTAISPTTETHYIGNIEQRNDGLGYTSNIGTRRAVANGGNDVAMTVLPNAPIDSATGLPVPTIAVATDGGTSVIKDDGTVVDFNDALGSTRPVSTVVIRGNDIVHWNINNGTMQQFFDALNATTDSTNDAKYNYTAGGGHATCENVSALLRDPGDGPYYLAVRDSKSIAAGAQSGMSVFVDGIDRTFSTNSATITDSRVAYITSNYNTGWMHGDIKSAFLSDTDTTNVTSSNLISGATYNNSDRITSYSYTNGSSTLVITDNPATADGYVTLTLGGLTPLTTYVLTVTANQTYTPTVGYNIHVGTTADGTVYCDDDFTGTASQNITFKTATSGDPTLVLYSNYNGALTYTLDLRLAEFDRSVGSLSAWNAGQSATIGQKRGLAVFGTITKSAVATGADLVAYSGFSASNYLEQPYNSDLEFGTSDFSVTFWAYRTTGNTKIMFDRSRQNATQNSRFSIYYNTSGSVDVYEGGGSTISASGALPLNVWTQITFVKNNSQGYLYENGNLVAGPTAFTINHNDAGSNPKLVIGNGYNYTYGWEGSLTLVRVSTSVPSAAQIKKMYEDEKVLFQENAKATLYGSSDAVTALAFDDTTELLHVGTSAGRSEFQGLRRINNTTTAVTTAISASNVLVAEQ